jgi:acylglycerol lipase
MEPTSETVLFGEQEIGWHVWQPSNDSGPLVVVFHGFLAHSRYPTVRYAAELFATRLPNATVVAADMPGHGTSSGLRGYFPGGAQSLINNFGPNVLTTAQEKYDPEQKRKLFLVGSSMGGTIALKIAQTQPKGTIDGVILLAPMLKLSVSSLEEGALQCLAMIVPSWNLIPSSSTSSEKQYRDVEKRKQCDTDALAISGSKIRIGSALTCVQLARTALELPPIVSSDSSKEDASPWTQNFPVWIGVADQDVVVDKTGSLDLHQIIQGDGGSSTLQVYPALHGLLCEPSPLYEQITNDLLTWMNDKL